MAQVRSRSNADVLTSGEDMRVSALRKKRESPVGGRGIPSLGF